jgi:6-phosphogluconolactonase
MSQAQRLVAATSAELVETAAARLADVTAESIRRRGRFLWALAGGSTPGALYRRLAQQPYRDAIEWDRCFVLFGDERAVPPTDERSNYRMANELLLSKVEIPAQNVLRMHGEAADLDAAAREYSARLEAFKAPLDLALLGMGDDGHTASLFPHTPALRETARPCVATDVAPLEPHVRRLTLTYPVFNAARKVWILVTGANKAERLARVLQGPRDLEEWPVQGIAPDDGELIWMLDEAALRVGA